jgi:hypothetical protein
MRQRAEVPEFRDRIGEQAAPKTGISGLKLVLLGALAPVALAGAVIGGMLVINSLPDKGAPAGKDEAMLDCRSPRQSWRWACQQATSADGYGVTVSAPAEGPVATTGSVQRQQPPGRSSTARGRDGEPIRAADAAAPAGMSQAPSQKAEVAKPEAASPPKKAWAEPTPEQSTRTAPVEAVPAATAPAPAPVPPSPKAKEIVSAPALTPMHDDEAPQAAAAMTPAVKPAPEAKAAPAAAPAAPAPVAAPVPPPKVSPAVAPEPAVASATARAIAPAQSPKIAPSETRKTAVAAEEEPAPRLSRKRVKSREAAAPRPKAIASRAVAKRARAARVHRRDEAPEITNGYRVMSLRTYTLPDGRRVIVQSAPRPEVVRELLAEHRATFGRQQFASPYYGRPAYGGFYADGW